MWDRFRIGLGQVWDRSRTSLIKYGTGRGQVWNRSRTSMGQVWDGVLL